MPANLEDREDRAELAVCSRYRTIFAAITEMKTDRKPFSTLRDLASTMSHRLQGQGITRSDQPTAAANPEIDSRGILSRVAHFSHGDFGCFTE